MARGKVPSTKPRGRKFLLLGWQRAICIVGEFFRLTDHILLFSFSSFLPLLFLSSEHQFLSKKDYFHIFFSMHLELNRFLM